MWFNYVVSVRTASKKHKIALNAASVLAVAVLAFIPTSYYVSIFGMTDAQQAIQNLIGDQGSYNPFVYPYENQFNELKDLIASHHSLPSCMTLIGTPDIRGIVSLDGVHYVAPGTFPVMVETCDSHNIVVGNVPDLQNWLNDRIEYYKGSLIAAVSFLGIMPNFVPSLKKKLSKL